MFNSTVLDVVIGLVFIYLLYSLLATVLQEIIATNINLRAKILKNGIERMLDDDNIKHKKSKLGDEKENEEITAPEHKQNKETLSKVFYKHPLIKYLGKNRFHSKPSYLTPQNFSKVLVDLLRGESAQPGQNFNPLIQKALNDGKSKWGVETTICPQTLSYLKSLWADAHGDIEKFKDSLEQWFTDTMERASGWYKKRTQLILFFIGLAIAIFFNVDTISIAKKLSNNPKLATQLADNASVYLQNEKRTGINQGDSGKVIPNGKITESIALIDSANSLVQKNIKDSNELLGLGWTKVCKNGERKFSFYSNFYWHSILGWIITALAISLGAPFWFDLLNKLMKLRSSVTNSSPGKKQEQEVQGPTIKRVG